jgi:hypothetical protein
MKLRSLIAISAISVGSMVMAQESRFSAGLELALPMGDFGDVQGIGFGVSLGYEIPVGDHLGILAQAGFTSFTAKEIKFETPAGTVTADGATLTAIPIQVGLKYYLSDNQEGFYLGLLTGLHLLTPEEGDGRSNFGIAPMLGYMVTENIDIALRYQMLFDSYEVTTGVGATATTVTESVTNSYLGLRAAYMFGSR